MAHYTFHLGGGSMPVLNGLDTTMELTRHAEALKARGYDFVLRYYSNNAAKNLSLGEARALSGAGLRIGVVWETSGTHATFFTRAQGLADGALAERGIAGLSWLSQSTRVAGSRHYAEE
jgi:hypothetical protein